EMWICERDIDGMKLDGMAHLTPVGGDHIRRRRQAGFAAKLRQNLPAGITLLRTTGVFGISEDIALSVAQLHGLLQGPRAVRTNRDARIRKSLRESSDRGHFLVAFETPALQFEILKSIPILRRLSEPDDRSRRQRLLIA